MALVFVVAVAVVRQRRREAQLAPEERRTIGRSLLVTLAVTFVVWLPPVIQEPHEPRREPERTGALLHPSGSPHIVHRGTHEHRAPGDVDAARRLRTGVLAHRRAPGPDVGRGRQRDRARVRGACREQGRRTRSCSWRSWQWSWSLASTRSPASSARSSSTSCNGSPPSGSSCGSQSASAVLEFARTHRSAWSAQSWSRTLTRCAVVAVLVLLCFSVREGVPGRCRSHQRGPRRAEQPGVVRLRADREAARRDPCPNAPWCSATTCRPAGRCWRPTR